MSKTKLYRSNKNRIIGGVCGGIAEYTNTDPTIIRLLWALGSLLWGAGVLGYIVAWIIIPSRK
jgi:phage shock protein C